MPAPTEVLDTGDVARVAGWQVDTVRKALWRARERRAAGATAEPHDFPEPTGSVSGRVWWSRDIIEQWIDARKARTAAGDHTDDEL